MGWRCSGQHDQSKFPHESGLLLQELIEQSEIYSALDSARRSPIQKEAGYAFPHYEYSESCNTHHWHEACLVGMQIGTTWECHRLSEFRNKMERLPVRHFPEGSSAPDRPGTLVYTSDIPLELHVTVRSGLHQMSLYIRSHSLALTV
jgi:hypothetical protein